MILWMQGALKVSMTSPGFIYEPYAPREQIPFWRRLDLFIYLIFFFLYKFYNLYQAYSSTKSCDTKFKMFAVIQSDLLS